MIIRKPAGKGGAVPPPTEKEQQAFYDALWPAEERRPPSVRPAARRSGTGQTAPVRPPSPAAGKAAGAPPSPAAGKTVAPVRPIPPATEQPAAPDAPAPQSFATCDELLAYAQGFLRHHAAHGGRPLGLAYGREILAQLYLALQTDQLILLVGRSGTGKSSLARHFPEVFGFAPAEVIPVQPDWTDRSDLLGYYNPIDRSYVATAFLDALLRDCRLAAAHPERLYFLCLDEMNLAHVEYYFAEFLSKLQEPVPEIRLYSDTVARDIVRELRCNGFTDEEIARPDADRLLARLDVRAMRMEERRYCISLCRMADMLARYPATVRIPRNVKFIGTLNQDETTLDLSPKVLDRSLVIRVEHAGGGTEETPDGTPAAYDRPARYQPLDRMAASKGAAPAKDGSDGLVTRLADELGLFYSPRQEACTFRDPRYPRWQRALGGNAAADAFLAMAVLPRLRLDAEAYAGRRQAVASFFRPYPVCRAIVDALGQGDAFDYWDAGRP